MTTNTPTRNTAVAVPSASTYDGFFFRSNLNSVGTVPPIAPYAQCPDIIASSELLSNFENDFSTMASWGQSYDCNPTIGSKTYYYLRGMNGAKDGQPENDKLRLYWTPAQLILFPRLWKNNPMVTQGQSESVSVSTLPGHIGVGSEALQFVAPSLPYTSTFYSFVSTAQSDTAPQEPSDLDWIGMGKMLTQNLNYGFRNMVHVSALASDWVHRVGLSVPQSVGSAATLQVTVSSIGFGGCTLAMLFDHYMDQKLVALNPATLSDGVNSGFSFEAEPGMEGSIAIQLWNPGAKVRAGSSITIQVSTKITSPMLEDAIQRGGLHSRYSRQIEGNMNVNVGPTAVLPLGAMTIVAN